MVKSITDKSIKELLDDLAQKRKALRDFRFGISGSKVRNVKEGHNLKREIAQILTDIRRRETENNG